MSSALILLGVLVVGYYLWKTGQLQPLLDKLGISLGGQQPAAPLAPTTGDQVGETYQKVIINNNPQPIEFRIDSGADYSIIRTESANLIKLNTSNPVRTQPINTVSGNVQAPVIQVTMKIGNTQPFQTEVLVFNSNFNLLAMRDITRVYDVKFTQTGTEITPKTVAAYTRRITVGA